MSWELDTSKDLLAAGDYIPGEMLDNVGRGQRGISEALLDLVGAFPDEAGRGAMCRVIAKKMVSDYLTAEGKEAWQGLRMIMDYTDGLPTVREAPVDPNVSRERVLKLTMRSADYEVVLDGDE